MVDAVVVMVMDHVAIEERIGEMIVIGEMNETEETIVIGETKETEGAIEEVMTEIDGMILVVETTAIDDQIQETEMIDHHDVTSVMIPGGDPTQEMIDGRQTIDTEETIGVANQDGEEDKIDDRRPSQDSRYRDNRSFR